MAASTSSQMITLKSSDDKEIKVPHTVAMQSKTISHLRRYAININFIPLLDVPESTLKMVIQYCEKHDVDAADASKIETTEESSSITHASSRISEEELRNWDNQFVDIDMSKLYDLLMAAIFLRINGLLDVIIQKMADKVRKSPDEICEYFNIETNFTHEDEEAIRHRFKKCSAFVI